VRVVVVGASGNVGTAVVRRLVAEPDVSLVGVSRRTPRGAPYDAVSWVRADLGAPPATERLAKAFAGADAVVHLGWRLQPSWDLEALERINVRGSAAVVDACLSAGVPHLVHASSVGAYAASPGPQRRDESWPATGIASSTYGRQKAAVERRLDRVDPGELGVLRLRPAIVLQPDAAGEIARFFLGPLVPTSLLRPSLLRRLPVLPWPGGLRIQLVHADDLADAIARALRARTTGALNVATEPVLDAAVAGAALGARPVPVPLGAVRALAYGTWRAHLQPTEPGWLDLATGLPLMDTTRAREELGWTPVHDAAEALLSFLPALAAGRGTSSPALKPRGLLRGRRALG
jgi:nucleoside-diphosphate-sugar epimerase